MWLRGLRQRQRAPPTRISSSRSVSHSARRCCILPGPRPAAAATARARRAVTVVNRGTERVVLPRPSLLAARQHVPTNAAADGPATRLEPIGPDQTVNVTLQFETAGAVTEQLTTQKRAQVLVAGGSSPVSITVGTPVS